jgi:vacuolar-type H+-ATPase subunit C/Vma6
VDTDASSTGVSGDVDYVEHATKLATVSGSTATCKVNIPYSWLMFTASTTQTNSLTASLDVFMYSPITTSITGLTLDLSREHIRAIVINGGKVADGTLTVTAAVTL